MYQPKANRENSLFFGRLAEWESTPRAIEVFDTVIAQSLPESQADFHRQLYTVLIDKSLEWLQLPRSSGAKVWEWRRLYQFGSEADPFYYTESSIHQLLMEWPVLDENSRNILFHVLNGYLKLRRAGFPSKFPFPVVSNAECERWARIFPQEWAWRSLEILRINGLVPLGSRRGYRVFARFFEGVFEPELTPDTLRRWQAECWRGSINNLAGEEDDLGAYRADILAAVFYGCFGALGFGGVCSDVPDCEVCTLNSDCRWYNASPSEQPGPSEILTLARQGHVEHFGTEQLLQGLFHLDESDTNLLRIKMAGTSLRELDTRNIQELKDLFGFEWLLPERMRVTMEICKRFNEERMNVGETFRTPWDIFKHFRIRLRDLKQEQFIVVMLNNKKQYLGDKVITQGTLDSSPVHPREVFHSAIRESAASVVIVHNHPSGDPTASKEDIEITRHLMDAGELVGIPVLDHVIIADEKYTSIMEQGLI